MDESLLCSLLWLTERVEEIGDVQPPELDEILSYVG